MCDSLEGIAGYEELRREFGEFTLRNLVEFRYYLDEEGIPAVNLGLETENRQPNFRVTLVCTGVMNVKFDGGVSNRWGVLPELEDVSTWQWEGIHWKVSEFEHNTFELLADSVALRKG